MEETPKTISIGQRCRILVGLPEAQVLEGTIRVLNSGKKDPGHQIGVELDAPIRYGHSLELELEREKVDPDTGISIGRGWWTLPENIELI